MSARPMRLEIYRSPTLIKLPPEYPHYTDDVPADCWRSDWRWRVKAGNGYVVGSSTEAFQRRAGLDANVLQLLGLDVVGVKVGDVVDLVRTVTGSRATRTFPSPLVSAPIRQTVRVEVTP